MNPLSALDLVLIPLALLGHLALGVALFNRLHAVGMHRRPRRLLELLLVGGMATAIAWYVAAGFYSGQSPFAHWRTSSGSWWPGYADLCLVAAAAIVPCWLWPRLLFRTPPQLVEFASRTIDINAEVGPIPLHGAQARFFSLVPGNEMLHLEVTTKTLRMADLPAALDGLTITHLSDLHYTGEIGREYYDRVIEQANQLASDVVIVSGDILESTACEAWVGETLGRLQAPLGKFYVLGNHDKRMPDVVHVRRLINEAGLIDLGGRALLASWRDCPVLLAGNERPWFAAVSDVDLERYSTIAFRVLVSHSPDQLVWARQRGFCLMLAGHNHGGQVCLPLVGPLIAPSLYGTRYAGGLFYESPTLLHVSRGISGEHPLRLWCKPEVTKLVLRRG